ncbi:class I SAM-dependent methyltransferase [Candidatus Pelagibacter communis]|uniref:class I SAM-dependent methyltransferase n=1 Tax=Pelagibacter ubique TaxID=198252 RepID=UPI00094D5EA3|nr:class I SAM-dependent methyltransferase [Candidatus Pelagibacter ubique]
MQNNNSKKKSIRSKNWFKIWEKKGHNLRNSKIETIIEADGFRGRFNKQIWFRYIKTIFSEIKIKKNSEILEYGCGAGAFLSFFYNKRYNLNGIDFSKSLIMKGKKYFPTIKFQCGEISKIDSFDKKFDLIFSHSVFHYFNDYHYAKSLIKKMLTGLKDNGYICILDVPDKEKERICEKWLINKIGIEKYKKKYGVHTHLFYKKSFFRTLAKKNDLKIKIFNQKFKFYENSKYRYNVIFKKKF